MSNAVIRYGGSNYDPQVYGLNETGALFWELLVAGSDRAAIRERLLQEFAVEPAELDVEIDALVAELARAGLVT